MDVGKGKTTEEFIKAFDTLRGRKINIQDQEEALIIGIVDKDYNFAENKNYKLLDAVPTMSTKVDEILKEYIGKFDTITSIYTAE